jgi:hypothetical protein
MKHNTSVIFEYKGQWYTGHFVIQANGNWFVQKHDCMEFVVKQAHSKRAYALSHEFGEEKGQEN